MSLSSFSSSSSSSSSSIEEEEEESTEKTEKTDKTEKKEKKEKKPKKADSSTNAYHDIDLPKWIKFNGDGDGDASPFRLWLVETLKSVTPGYKSKISNLNATHQKMFIAIAKGIRKWHNIEKRPPVFSDEKIDDLNLLLFTLQIIPSVKIPENLAQVNISEMCWLSTAAITWGGRPSAQYKYKVLENRDNHQGLRLYTPKSSFSKSSKSTKGNRNELLYRFMCVIKNPEEYSQEGKKWEASHRCHHRPQLCISPYCQRPETHMDNLDRTGCINSCANYCPHKHPCLFRSHKTGLDRPCRSNPDKAVSKGDCKCEDPCWTDDDDHDHD